MRGDMEDQEKESLLKEFPALEPVIDRVRSINGVIGSARLIKERSRSLCLSISFDLGGVGIQYSLYNLKDMETFFEICGADSLEKIPGKYVRVEEFHQASWCPFFKVYHITDDEKSFVFRYALEELKRYSRGERV